VTRVITAAVVNEPGAEFSLEQLELDDPQPGEVVVEIKGVGLCHSDLIARDGLYGRPYPVVVGHEGAGVVVETGPGVRGVGVGDSVVLSFESCGRCPACRDAAPAYCWRFPELNNSGAREDGTATLLRNGEPVAGSFFGQSSFATFALASHRNVVKVPAGLPLEILGPLGCAIQTGAGAVMNSFDCPAGSSVLVLGAGPVGLAAVLAGAVRGCEQVIVVEPLEPRRQLALELGATNAVDPAAGNVAEQVRMICPGGVGYAIDTTGLPAVLESAIGCLAKRGALGLIGAPRSLDVALPLNLVTALSKGIRICGISEGDSKPDVFIPELLELFRNGQLPFDRLVSRFPFSEINAAVEAQGRGAATKVVRVV
jgi:aryl-alcohol dehydrogenase